ncbi:TRAP transporter small permease [Maribellus sp. CM-23]|uniref:TRAP transporter small permease n=1 Tax=Maribellus sp. CM-23 TaxID=2781026 RepID=UPI001F20C4B6|nr:TRAP transporter small permease [Maribellus sp. CM-23]MCE4565134.1 TRAP transporter small permease [Maribellus sp. CM-23]
MRQKIDKIIEIVLVALMSILVIDVLWQVFSRYVLSAPSSFTDELAGFLLIWVGLLGSAYVAGKNEHLAIDLLLQKMKGMKKRRLQIIINSIVGLFALFVMVVGGVWLVYTRFYLGVNSAALALPLGYVYLVVPVSGLLIIYYSIDNSLNLNIED